MYRILQVLREIDGDNGKVTTPPAKRDFATSSGTSPFFLTHFRPEGWNAITAGPREGGSNVVQEDPTGMDPMKPRGSARETCSQLVHDLADRSFR